MKKLIIIIIIFILFFFSVYYFKNSEDLKKTFTIIEEKLSSKKPEPNTEEMYNYLVDKASKDSELSDNSIFDLAIKYIYNNIDKCENNNTMENLIYYGSVLHQSAKSKNNASYTLIGLKTQEAVKEVYIKDNMYKTNKKSINKSKAEVIKVLIKKSNKN